MLEDDDDLFAAKGGKDLGGLLDLPSLEAPSPPPSTGGTGVAAPGPAGAADRAPAGAARTPKTPEPEFDPEFGEPGATLPAKLAYAYRVATLRTRFVERAAMIRRGLDEDRAQLEAAHLRLGREAFDRIEAQELVVSDDAVASVRAALAALDEHETTSRREREAREQEAQSRRAEAAAEAQNLSPLERAQDEAYAAVDTLARERELAKGRVAVAEAGFSRASLAGMDAMKEAEREVDAARTALREVERRHRETQARYAELRRKVVAEMSRVVEAGQAADGAAVSARRIARDAERRRDDLMRRVDDAYQRLGVLVHDRKLAAQVLAQADGEVGRVRAARARDLATAEELERRAIRYDVESFTKGKLVAFGAAAGVFALLGLVAALA